MDLNVLSAETMAKVTEILKQGPSAELTQLVSAGGIRKDYPSGLVAYDLAPVARVLQPVITPLRNRLPRVSGKGGTAVNWKQITSLDVNRRDIFQAAGTKAPVVSYSSVDRAATYRTFAMGDNINIQAMLAARGLEDGKAQMVVRLLANVMVLEERGLIGGRNAALGTVTAPTVGSSATGGSIAAATYNVIVRATCGPGTAGTTAARGKKSSATSTGALSGSTNQINASTPWVEGATGYEWYVGTAGNEKLEATTVINSVNLTALAGTGATAAGVSADDSADANALDGFIAQLTASAAGYAKTLATGTNGTGTPFQLSDIDTMLLNLYNTYGADPEILEVNPQQSVDLTNKVIASGNYRIVVPDAGSIGQLTGGYRVNAYINKTTGRVMQVETNPWWPQGQIAAISLGVPVPLGEITNAWDVVTQLDYFQLEYAQTAPKYEVEVMSIEALRGWFLLGAGIIRNIANG